MPFVSTIFCSTLRVYFTTRTSKLITKLSHLVINSNSCIELLSWDNNNFCEIIDKEINFMAYMCPKWFLKPIKYLDTSAFTTKLLKASSYAMYANVIQFITSCFQKIIKMKHSFRLKIKSLCWSLKILYQI